MARMLAWVGVALLAAYLVFIGGGWLGIYTSGLRITTVSFAAVGLAIWAFVAWRRPEWRPRSVLLPAILACLGSMAISTVFSRVPRVSLEYLGYAILLAALYLLLVRLMASPFFRARLVSTGTVLFIAIAVEFFALVVYLWIQWWQQVGHLAIPPLRPNFIGLSWGNPSAILTMVALFAVPTAARFVSWRPRGIVTFLLIGLVVAVVALLTGSRAGWLSLGLTGLVGIIALLAIPEPRGALREAISAVRPAVMSRRLQVALAVGGVLAIGGAIAVLPAVLERVAAGGEDLRTSFYVVALRIFATSPIVGTGPGTWVIQRSAFTQPSEVDYYIPHAHDVPVQTLAELGIVGAVAGLILAINLAWLVVSSARSPDRDRQKWAWLTGLGLLYFGLHNLLDFYPNMPAALFAAALPVAYLDATASRGPSLPRVHIPVSFGTRTSLAGLALVAVATAGLLLQEVPVLRNDDALAAANSGDWAAALAPAESDAAADPDISPFQLTAGLAAAHAGDHAAAAAYFQRVATRDDLPEAWLDLAAEQAELGRTDDATTSLHNALRLGYQRAEVAMPAADLALRLGLRDLAIQIFTDSIERGPSLGGDPWWQADPIRAAALSEAIKAALAETSPDGGWIIALMSGDVAGARTLAAASLDPARAARIIDAWTGSAEALDAMLADCSAHPLNGDGIVWCARLEARAGNAVEAARFRDQSESISAGSSGATLLLRVATPSDTGPSVVPAGAYTWGVYTYRRWTPTDMLVPSLIHLRLE